MSKHKRAVIIIWDSRYCLRAFDAKRVSSSEIYLQNIHSSSGTQENLSRRISILFDNIDSSGETHIVFTPCITPFFNLDVKIPKIPSGEIKNALAFELQSIFPIPLEELTWAYWIKQKEEKTLNIRVMAVTIDSFNNFLSILSDSNAKIDYFFHPAFLEIAQNKISLEQINQIFEDIYKDINATYSSFDWKEKIQYLDCAQTKFNQDIQDDNCGILIAKSVAYHFLNNNSIYQISSTIQIPQKLKPIRFKFLKITAISLLLLNILLFLLLCFRYSADARKQYFDLKKEKALITSELLKISSEDAQNKELDEFIKKLSEADPGNHEIPEAFLSLSKSLSSQIWLTMFSARGQEIELTIASKDDANIQTELAKLNNLPIFSNVTVRNTRREKDGTVVLYIKLNQEKNKQKQ